MHLALFLDRDGVINLDCAYVHESSQFKWIPGIFDTVRFANQRQMKVIVVTNQAGIARGYYTEQQFHRLTDWMTEQFAVAGAPLTAVYYCPYHPDGSPPYRSDSPFRKPAPGMLLRAAEEHDIDLSRSLLIGDQETDVAAGRAAGLRAVARFCPYSCPHTAADAVLSNHSEACAWIEGVVDHHGDDLVPVLTMQGPKEHSN